MTLHPRAAGTTIILEHIGSDPSGNNDRPRETVDRMTIAAARALAAELEQAIEAAIAAEAAEQAAAMAKAERELVIAEARVAELRAVIARGRGGDEPAGSEAAAPVASEPQIMTEQELLDGLERQGLIKRAEPTAPMVPAPTQAVAARALVELEPEMPDFLRRTA